MKPHAFICLIGVMCVMPVHAENAELQTAIEQASRSGQASEVLLYGQPATVVPIQNQPCGSVGVVYQESRRQHGGARIDNYQVCAGAEPERIDEVSPALPDDQQFKQLTQMAIRGALRYGSQRREWNNYRLDARRLSAADSYGCAQIESTVSSDGLLVSYNVGRLCP